MDAPRLWHRLFGLALVDFFRGMPVTVELEKDLSLKQQLLDVVVIHKEPAPLPRRLPDGFEDLAAHNLVTFKSYQEALDGWALNELVGHYVNYRKQISPSMQDLLPETDFRLFAVCIRYPQGLANEIELTPISPGVYDAKHFSGRLRVIVANKLPQEEHNSLLHLFSARMDLLRYGTMHYQQQSQETSQLLMQLLKRYLAEGASMPDSLELLKQFCREADDELRKRWPAKERLEGLTAEERLKGLTPDEVLAAMPPEDRAKLLKRLRDDESLANPGK